MLFVMAVSLYTSRIILQALGVTDFGINNVVGGLVTSLSFLRGCIASGTNRFYAYYIGKNDRCELSTYYKISLTCFLLLSLICLVISESIGLLFLNTQLQIDECRMYAANWVFQCAIISFIISLMIIPHQAMIIAHENMSVYAYIGIIEILAKLGVVYLIQIGNIDRLILYSILNVAISGILFLFYYCYCKKRFDDVCHWGLYFKWLKVKEFLSYSVWIIFGALSGVCRDQGINIVINIFFGPTINAARGIAYQVNRAVAQFLNNFYMAVRPQITIRYAAGKINEMHELVFSSSRLCFFLTFILSVPLLIQMPDVLSLWLHDVPDHTIAFTRLVLIVSMIESIAYPLDTAITSTGRVKKFQFFTGGLLMINLPISYIVIKNGYPAESTMIVMIIVAIFAHCVRVYIAKCETMIQINIYMLKVLVPILLVCVCAYMPLYYIYYTFIHLANVNILTKFLMFSIVSVIYSAFVMYCLGINKGERARVHLYIKNKLSL